METARKWGMVLFVRAMTAIVIAVLLLSFMEVLGEDEASRKLAFLFEGMLIGGLLVLLFQLRRDVDREAVAVKPALPVLFDQDARPALTAVSTDA